MGNRMKHSIVGRLALPLAVLALAAPAQAARGGHVPPYGDGKAAAVVHNLQGDVFPGVEVRHSGPYSYIPKLDLRGSETARKYAPPGYVPRVYVTSSDSTRDVAPIARRGQSPVVTGGGELDGVDMGIGAGVAFGGLLLAGGLALTMRRTYRPTEA